MTESARSVAEIVALCSLLGIIILSAIFGNTLVCVAVYRSSTLRSQVSNIFIVNLAMTDFFNAVLVMPATFISLFTNRWVLSEYWCDGVCFLNYCFIIVSMWTLGLVSLDRYFAVVQPFRYTAIVTNTRACVALACTWFLGFIFASPPVFMQWVWYDNLEAICAINWEANTRQVVAYTLTAFAVCFCVPAIVMSFAYAGIYRVARRQTRRIQAEIDQVAQSIAINGDVDAQHENTACTSERSEEDVSNQNTRNKRKRTTNNNDRKQPRRKGKAVRTYRDDGGSVFLLLDTILYHKSIESCLR
ncbi:D(1C) dopamine receptor-like [Ptychodera flava]|uniref:D(1C) dopamine receptor-like n=1 Tax=Ptychodera flava TaxID=63121 RepID=UPI003969E840